jgi:hypothetical protein
MNALLEHLETAPGKLFEPEELDEPLLGRRLQPVQRRAQPTAEPPLATLTVPLPNVIRHPAVAIAHNRVYRAVGDADILAFRVRTRTLRAFGIE